MNDTLTRLEEWINSMTHYFGAVLALIGTGALLVHSLKTNNIGYVIGCMVFCFSLVLLYTMSGTYHILYVGKIKKLFKILDHSAIYILISGSYTPYLLGVFDGTTKWVLFFIQWGMTLFGILFKVFFVGRFNFISTLIYLFMGWMVMFVFKDLQVLASPLSLKLLIWGGISYSVGTIFYLMKNKKFTHGIWHLFVLAGSVFNYFSVYFLI
ncbi:hemolysin III family protein [Cetobacterium somerae]|uniref:PAQR family membrane homeostasis protein TrhA n=1 Tax=Cetobacterium sp. NK01 TaxID=2993530 RepID=UPI00211726A7|nr:hemolysin III family protein [Cetobacterium sp. NK01]MCQ8211771.1 hemolysin III family protein [Cetobacterium sp. NK01]